jgi:hypothetical protein
MADPVIPATPTPDDVNNLAAIGELANKAKDAFDGFGSAAQFAQGAISSFTNSLGNFKISLDSSKSLTESQTVAFGMLSASILGVRKSFDNLGSGIDPRPLSTFTSQIDDLRNSLLSGNNAFASAAEKAKAMAEAVAKATGMAVPAEIVKQGVNAISKFAKNMLESADNALRLQNAYIQLSAKTGNLSQVFAAAGPNLNNINALLEKQSHMMTQAVKATGLAPEVVEKYYAELGNVPKALEEVVTSSSNTDKKVSMLTATIKLATGTGRSYTDVMDDLKVAFRNYGLVGEDALKFSARMGEVANNLGVEFDTVKKALTETSGTFRMFADTGAGASRMVDGLAGVMNNYSTALEKTGLSGTQAVDVVKNMISQVGNLSIAQKSFLSAQTGGAGGLMGAFQIDKMMREGKIDEVFEKVRQQMTKQFGKIVTVDEAASSPAAAAQMTRQMMMLKQGPMGQFAKTDVEAQRILEGFKARQEGKATPKELSDKIVQQSMDKGTAIQEKSYTELSRMRAIMEETKGTANISNLGLIQQGFSVSGGTPFAGKLSEDQMAQKANVKSTMTGATNQNYAAATDYGRAIASKEVINTTGRHAVSAIEDFQKMFANIPLSLKAPMDALKNAISAGNTKATESELKSLAADIKKRKEDMDKLPQNQKAAAMAQIRTQEEILKASSGFVQAATGRDVLANKQTTVAPMGRLGDNRPKVTAGDKLNLAANRAVTAVPAATQTPTPGTTSAASATGRGANASNDITVHVTGYCLKCKQEIEGGQHSKSVNPASTNSM